MKILIDIGHPAQVHFFKHFIWRMQEKGHEFLITAKEKDVAFVLLDAYKFQYRNVGHYRKGLFAKAKDMLIIDWRMFQIARKFQPDIVVSAGSPNAAHVAALVGKPHITFDDTEHSRQQYYLYAPFTRIICTPTCFKKDLGKKQVRYNGYKELAHLRPEYFKPDSSITGQLGLAPDDKFVVVRFVSWQATHDVGQYGFSLEEKRLLINKLEKYARVFITSEGVLPTEFEKYRLTVSPEKIHDLLYSATLYIGEGATMATEAAVLGTPSIYVSSLAGTMGNFIELEQKYDLLYTFQDAGRAIEKAIELVQQLDLKKKWAEKRKRLIADKIDVTRFMIDLIENYPDSLKKYRK